jgi:hypothetical protein
VRYGRFEGSSPYRDKDGSIRRKLKVSFIYQASSSIWMRCSGASGLCRRTRSPKHPLSRPHGTRSLASVPSLPDLQYRRGAAAGRYFLSYFGLPRT